MKLIEILKNIINLYLGDGMTPDDSFWHNIKNFKKSEFEDDQGECWINKDLVAKLDTARFHANTPFKINSACRNEAQNTKAGGSETSSHLTGFAVDINAISSRAKFNIVKSLLDVGFHRIGIAATFIHVDNDPGKAEHLIWTYGKK
jgi:uncharacterized protein YcbK (DUF882 family)